MQLQNILNKIIKGSPASVSRLLTFKCDPSVVNPKSANHNNCRLLCHLLVNLKPIFANRSSLIRVHTVCLYAKMGFKSLQEYSADDINRRNFQIQVFLAFSGLIFYGQYCNLQAHFNKLNILAICSTTKVSMARTLSA